MSVVIERMRLEPSIYLFSRNVATTLDFLVAFFVGTLPSLGGILERCHSLSTSICAGSEHDKTGPRTDITRSSPQRELF
jgi:hypothetical protein